MYSEKFEPSIELLGNYNGGLWHEFSNHCQCLPLSASFRGVFCSAVNAADLNTHTEHFMREIDEVAEVSVAVLVTVPSACSVAAIVIERYCMSAMKDKQGRSRLHCFSMEYDWHSTELEATSCCLEACSIIVAYNRCLVNFSVVFIHTSNNIIRRKTRNSASDETKPGVVGVGVAVAIAVAVVVVVLSAFAVAVVVVVLKATYTMNNKKFKFSWHSPLSEAM